MPRSSALIALAAITLAATPAFGQLPPSGELPNDALRSRVYAPNTVRQRFQAANATAVEEARTEHSAHYRLPGGGRLAVLSQFMNWNDPETGQILPVEPALWTLDNGWRMEGGPVKARVVRNGDAWALELYHQRGDKQWKTLAFAIPAPTHSQDLTFTFPYQNLTWKLKLTELGFDLTADVAARQGGRIYTFPHSARLLDLSVDPSTGDLTGNEFRLTRALMVRADRIVTPCSPWRNAAGNLSFTCDDSEFPPEAFPYVIDPTGSFYPADAADDGWAEIAGSGTGSCPVWPNGLTPNSSWGYLEQFNKVMSRTDWIAGGYCYTYSDQAFVRFDTSSIPSSATINSASVSVYAVNVSDGNQSVGAAGCSVQADWYASSNWPLTYNEWNLWGSGNAVAPQDLTGKTTGWNTFALSNLANIPKGAGAYAGLKWSVPCSPAIPPYYGFLFNEFNFYSFDSGASTKPYLTVTYTASVVRHTITSSPAGRALTVDGVPCTAAPCYGDWIPGTSHTIAVTTTPQDGATGIRYVFLNWGSLGNNTSYTFLAPSAPAIYTANFTTQYKLTTAVSPTGGGTISPATTPTTGWYNSGQSVQISATPASNYYFSVFSGALTQTTSPQSVTMSAPRSVTANFGTVRHEITSVPAGRTLTVDNASCTAPCPRYWMPGSSHTIATTSPQNGATDTRYVFANWSDAGAISHSVTAASSATTYTANFTTQYKLTTSATAGGTISPATNWHNSGSPVSVSATANSGYTFSHFSGALSGSTNPRASP